MASRGHGKGNRGGFSLVELLTTLSILTILLALVTPALLQGRDKIRAFTCQANLHQIGMATTFYAQDYDDQFASPNNEPYRGIPDAHRPYLKHWGVWNCPADARARRWDGWWDSETFRVRASYIWNAYVFQGDPADWRRSIPASSIPFPTTLVVWAEGYANPGWVNEGAPMSAPQPRAALLHSAYGDSLNAVKHDPTAAPCPIRHDEHLDVIHEGGGNYAFADGHAKWLRPTAFTTATLIQNGGEPVDDRTDPFVTNGARAAALNRTALCPVFCCPKDIGTPPSDGEHPWFRP
ncbi:MAG TPA: prepilin-type N-terminal cleavage/methylation domain-containing protein [Chthonomonadaceae bacterium]|nr:prepilin-type N-terminal cleavage/methylation domain-containing protein [Chthonomonadaceae bacterium]